MTTQPPSWGPSESPRGAWAPGPPPQSSAERPTQQTPANTGERPSPVRDGRGRDWRITAMTIGVVLLVIVGILVYVLGNSTSKTSRARLDSALHATSSAGTADLTIDIKASFAGASFSITASGAVDFSTKALSLHMSDFGETLSFVETNDVLYANLGELVGKEFPGKTWVRIPMSAFADAHDSQLLLTDDPQAMASILLKLGATITPTGTTTIEGSKDEGYRIRVTLADLESHESELPPSLRSLFATAKTMPNTAAVSATMYVDSAGQLQAAHVVVTAQATGHPVTASIDLTMSHFGTASVPTAPPATQTVTYRQWKGSSDSGALPLTIPDDGQAT